MTVSDGYPAQPYSFGYPAQPYSFGFTPVLFNNNPADLWFTKCNKKINTAPFLVADPKEQAEEIFRVVPSCGFLEAHITHISHSKMILKIHFTAR